MRILSAMDIKNGAITKESSTSKMGTLTQPIQFLTQDNKDEAWGQWNMDWLEHLGLQQVGRNARRLLKNYKLASGIIDKTDYIIEEDNEVADMIEILNEDDESAFDLKFFPIIPNVINVLTGEFAKRNDKITYNATDEKTYNEMLEMKYNMIEEIVLAKGEADMRKQVEALGLNPEDEQQGQQIQQMMNPENIKTLPDVQDFFTKDYRSIPEQWATHQHEVDTERFDMNELEVIGFGDMLKVDREFWHFLMYEDDYDIEIWNPVTTFYHKSPEIRYISQGNFVGKFDLMTIPDIIDKYGAQMNKEQLEYLEEIYPIKNAGYVLPGLNNSSGDFYDTTQTHDWNINGDSLAMRQHQSFNDMFGINNGDIIDDILGESEDLIDFNNQSLIRVTTAYWKSQKLYAELTSVNKENGMIENMIVDEDYKITKTAVYDNTLIKGRTKYNIIAGEHLDWLWVNETWGGKKLGPNKASSYMSKKEDFQPIYLDVEPLRFQFKGDFSLYGCKLPVEGSIFSDRNTKSTSLVDKMKPYQIGFNMVNNQIADILIDELGTIIMLDQNTLPKHSMGEDWGDNNFEKAFVAMKDFQMLPLDTSITNTENATQFGHYQKLDLSQTQRLLSRVQLANYFKQQCFESIGISPQRMGAVNAQETAQGIEQAINMSYSQTEMYFVQHSEYLMPRVHKMRTDLAQYYHSTNPSVRLQYLTSLDEKINFELEGTSLLLRDINVHLTTKINQKQLMESIKRLALENNTAGASVYDLGDILKSNSMSEIDSALKSIEKKTSERLEADRKNAMDIEQQRIAAEKEALKAKQAFDANESKEERDKDIRVAEIRAAALTGMNDRDNNNQNDYIDTLEYLNSRELNSGKLAIEKEKIDNDKINETAKIHLKDKELDTKKYISDNQVKIAVENKTNAELAKKKKPAKKK